METVGFYYDKQLSERQLTCCLYPNRIPTDDPMKWDPPEETEEDFWNSSTAYSTKPIVTAITTEDLQISVSNEWTQNGMDPIGSTWNTYKPLAPYLEKVGDFFKDIGGQSKSWVDQNKDKAKDSGFYKVISKAGDIFKEIGNLTNSSSNLLQRSLVVQGTRFVYYSGTGIDFGTLSMKFTLLPTYTWAGIHLSVVDQLQALLPYVVGEFVPVNELKKIKKLEELGGLVSKYMSWQLPPGGFKPDIKDVDTVQEGTLKLVIGGYYGIENLVISSAQFNMSKVMAKSPEAHSGDYSPLYCEVVLNLKPATKYSKVSLERLISGEAFKLGRQYNLTKQNFIPDSLKKDSSTIPDRKTLAKQELEWNGQSKKPDTASKQFTKLDLPNFKNDWGSLHGGGQRFNISEPIKLKY